DCLYLYDACKYLFTVILDDLFMVIGLEETSPPSFIELFGLHHTHLLPPIIQKLLKECEGIWPGVSSLFNAGYHVSAGICSVWFLLSFIYLQMPKSLRSSFLQFMDGIPV